VQIYAYTQFLADRTVTRYCYWHHTVVRPSDAVHCGVSFSYESRRSAKKLTLTGVNSRLQFETVNTVILMLATAIPHNDQLSQLQLYCMSYLVRSAITATSELLCVRDWKDRLCKGRPTWLLEGVLMKISIECWSWQWRHSCQHESKLIPHVAHVNTLGSRPVSADQQTTNSKLKTLFYQKWSPPPRHPL